MLVEITPAALRKLRALITEAETDGPVDGPLALRIAVRPGGCSGFSYDLCFDTERSDGDVAWAAGDGVDALTVVVDAASAPLLRGATLEYHETLQRTGFTFTNPNAARTCGCGSSFS